MTAALEGGEWSAARPGPTLPPGKDPVPILQEAGWAPGPVWTGGKSHPHRDSIPDRPARSRYTDWATRPTSQSSDEIKNECNCTFVPPRSYLDIIPMSPSSRPTRGSNHSVTLNCRDLSQVRPASCVECCMGLWFHLTNKSFLGCYLFGTLVSWQMKPLPWVVAVWAPCFIIRATLLRVLVSWIMLPVAWVVGFICVGLWFQHTKNLFVISARKVTVLPQVFTLTYTGVLISP